MFLLRSVGTKWLISSGVGFGLYLWRQKPVDFINIGVVELNQEELNSFSDKWTYYRDFIKQHNSTSHDIQWSSVRIWIPDLLRLMVL
jgi:hypothetical protein